VVPNPTQENYLITDPSMSMDTIRALSSGVSGVVTVTPYEGLVIPVEHGGTGTVAVSLPSRPSGNVTVTVTVIDAGYGLTVTSGATLTFTPSNYATPQNVTFTATSAGNFRVLFAPSGSAVFDFPGIQSTTIHVTAS
jgi:hypothetical protein